MTIEIWSDFACPYCYIGDNRLKKALKETGIDADVTYRTFQLDPNTVRRDPSDYVRLLADKYNKPYEETRAQVEEMITSGKKLGLNFDFDRLIRTNTGLAHKVAKYARDLGKEQIAIDRIFKAYFEEGQDLGDFDTLKALLNDLDISINKKNLEETNYHLEIREDYKEASSLGISGVPFFVIDNKYAISGAQSFEYFKSALTEIKNKTD